MYFALQSCFIDGSILLNTILFCKIKQQLTFCFSYLQLVSKLFIVIKLFRFNASSQLVPISSNVDKFKLFIVFKHLDA